LVGLRPKPAPKPLAEREPAVAASAAG
jgi:hypothetical protein